MSFTIVKFEYDRNLDSNGCMKRDENEEPYDFHFDAVQFNCKMDWMNKAFYTYFWISITLVYVLFVYS